jgi:DNA-binding transcriptional LysR family regulator
MPERSPARTLPLAAQHLSFTAAARSLNVTQTAISHQIRGLEAELGVALFRRLPRRLAAKA